MPYIIRSDEEIISAVRAWLHTCPLPKDAVALTAGDTEYTIAQLIETVGDKSSMAFNILVVNARELAQKYGRDPLDMFKK